MADCNTSTPSSNDVRGRVWSDNEVSMLLDVWSSKEIISKFEEENLGVKEKINTEIFRIKRSVHTTLFGTKYSPD